MKKLFLFILFLLLNIDSLHPMDLKELINPLSNHQKPNHNIVTKQQYQSQSFFIKSDQPNFKIEVQELIGLYKNIIALPLELQAHIYKEIYYRTHYEVKKYEKPQHSRISRFFDHIGPNSNGDEFTYNCYSNDLKNITGPTISQDFRAQVLHPTKPLLITTKVIRNRSDIYLHSYIDSKIKTQHVTSYNDKTIFESDDIQFGSDNILWIRDSKKHQFLQYNYEGKLLSSFNYDIITVKDKIIGHKISYHCDHTFETYTVDPIHNYILASYKIVGISEGPLVPGNDDAADFSYRHRLFNNNGEIILTQFRKDLREPQTKFLQSNIPSTASLGFSPPIIPSYRLSNPIDYVVTTKLLSVNATKRSVSTDFSKVLLSAAAKKIIEQKTHDKTQCKTVMEDFSEHSEQETIRQYAIQIFNKDIFKELQQKLT